MPPSPRTSATSAPDASLDDVRQAAAAAGMRAFIEALPQGYETVVGERGLALSAGERQRVALARAFLASPAVLVLDEPTAALDPVIERQVIDGYRAVMRGRTTLLITHRRDLAMRADRVDRPRRRARRGSGRAAELLARAGAFARLFGELPAVPFEQSRA